MQHTRCRTVTVHGACLIQRVRFTTTPPAAVCKLVTPHAVLCRVIEQLPTWNQAWQYPMATHSLLQRLRNIVMYPVQSINTKQLGSRSDKQPQSKTTTHLCHVAPTISVHKEGFEAWCDLDVYRGHHRPIQSQRLLPCDALTHHLH